MECCRRFAKGNVFYVGSEAEELVEVIGERCQPFNDNECEIRCLSTVTNGVGWVRAELLVGPLRLTKARKRRINIAWILACSMG